MIRILRTVFLGCFLPFLGIGLAQGTQGAVKEQTAAPVIVVEESTYDFGQVSQGKVLTHEFRVLNQGTAPLEIKKVKPGWGCSVARFDRTIPPGGEGKITLEVKTKGFQGNVHKTARVTSNDPKRSQITIGMKGKVWVPIQMTPRYGRLIGVLGDNIETLVTLQAGKKDSLEIALASVSIPEKISVELIEVEKGRRYNVKIKNKVGEQTNYNGQVKLSTNYPEIPELSIPVAGNIRPLLDVRPRVINFGAMTHERVDAFRQGKKYYKRPVTIVLNRGKDLKVEKLELENLLFTAKIAESQFGEMVQILVEPNFEKLKKGKFEDCLKVYTNQKGYEILEIPLQFEIR